MQSLERAIMRILRADGKVAGTGFLVAPNLAVTCAHVVVKADALDGDTIQVQFPNTEEKIPAVVEPQYWREIAKGDVAFLRLESTPQGMVPLRLGLAEHSPSGNPFTAFGYATAAGQQGIWARGNIINLLPDKSYLQIRAHEANHGMSGAPVLDEKRDVVVGMITLGNTEPGRNQETTFATPSEFLFDVCDEFRPSEISPYLGLEFFTAETSRYFFGRRALIERLLDALRDKKFLAVFGPSGSGKSSLVRAGLLPALAKSQVPGSEKWAQVVMRPTEQPFEAMKSAGLESFDVDDYLKAHPGFERVVLFIDQFEEIFTLTAADTREKFLDELNVALENPGLIFLLAMRDDFYSEFNAKAAQLAQSEYIKIENVPAVLRKNEVLEMVEQPAALVGLSLEDGLADRIVKDLIRDGKIHSSSMPLMEFTLTQLWERRRDGQITHDSYQFLGGVSGCLARWADQVYNGLAKDSQAQAQDILTSFVRPGDKTDLPDTRKRRRINEFDDAKLRLINHFVANRLLSTSDTAVEFVHDSIINEWGKLKDWVEKDRERLQFCQNVSEAAKTWQESQYHRDLLIHRGGQLTKAKQLTTLNPDEQKYLRACEEAESIDKEKGKRSWQTQKALRIILALLALSLVAAFLLRERPVPGKWVLIPSGNFTMGMSDDEREMAVSLCAEGALEENKSKCTGLDGLLSESGQQQAAWLPDFFILDNEVTNAQYQQCVDAEICLAPKNWSFDKNSLNQPAASLNWFEAGAYCEWLGGRLPTEGEWEKAARGPNDFVFPWGNVWEQGNANIERSGVGNVAKVTTYEASDLSGYQVKNLTGNVQEWTASEAVSIGPEQAFSNIPFEYFDAGFEWPIIVRGGSWVHERSHGMAAKRATDGILTRRETLGFRCVCFDEETCKKPWTWEWAWFGQ